MRYLSYAALLITSSYARVDPDVACKSMCGLDHRVSARDCEVAVADGSVCRYVYREASADILFSAVSRSDIQQITVAEAIAETQAIENNCFAMCFGNMLCRNQGSYCTEAGVCAALFWNKQKRQAGDSYDFHIGGPADASNQDAPVTCDSATPEELPGRVDPLRIDPCIATCHLNGSSPDTCRWVQESNGRCARLFWTNPAKTDVVFSPRAPQAPQMEIEASELIELLKAPSNNCAALCDSIPTCRADAKGSFCRANGACQGLFYQNGTRPVRAELIPCYGSGCNELTPVMCDPSTPSSHPTDAATTVAHNTTTTGSPTGQPTVGPSSQPSRMNGASTSVAPSQPNAANAVVDVSETSRDLQRMSQPTAAMIVLAVIAVAFF